MLVDTTVGGTLLDFQGVAVGGDGLREGQDGGTQAKGHGAGEEMGELHVEDWWK